MAKTPVEQLTEAQSEITRLQGLESQFNAALAQVPGGNVAGLTTLIAEHGQFRADAQRLGGELTTANGEVTRLNTEVTRLTTELSTAGADLEVRAEARAAEIVAATGNQEPAKADSSGAGGGAVKAAAQRSSQEHWDHYATLSAEDKNAYYRANIAAMSK